MQHAEVLRRRRHFAAACTQRTRTEDECDTSVHRVEWGNLCPKPEAVGGKNDPLDPSRGCGASPCFAFFLPTLDAPPRAFPALLVLSLPLAALALAALAPRSRQPLLTASMIARRRDDTARTVGRAKGIQPTFLNAAARFGRGITKTTLRRPHNFSYLSGCTPLTERLGCYCH